MCSKHILRVNGKTRFTAISGSFRPGSLAITLLIWLLAGCAGAPPPVTTAPVAVPEGSASAAELMERARRSAADRAAQLYLQAAWAYLEADDPDSADTAFQAVEPGWLDGNALPEYRLLSATMAMHQDDLPLARSAMDSLPADLRSTDRARRILSTLCEAEADYDCAVRNLVAAAGEDPADNDRIWHLLGASLTLADIPPGAARSADAQQLPGWRSLQQAAIVPFSAEESRTAVQRWIASHPDHPAALIPPAAVSRLLERESGPRRIALLLPLSGPLARAGEAVRDGYLAASFLTGASGRISISIYDSASEPIPVLYERILADGADLLIGPLQKSAVTELAALNPELPVLALNYLDETGTPAGAFNQFGLAIEDEAATIASRLHRDGVQRALLFHNYEDWSLRARRALSASGDIALTVQPFTDLRTITEAVGTAMHVESSQARHEELAQLLRTDLEFLPRAREDVDAVVALVSNTEANALVPALRFHFANQLPVYSSSQITRRTRTRSLGELNGFHVSELPFFLEGDAVYDALATAFGLADNPFAPLMALGTDAFRIGERLDATPGSLVLLGSTGLLKQHPDGRITRELAWGVVSGGAVRPDHASRPDRPGVGD